MAGWLDPPDLSVAGRRRALLRLLGVGLACGWLGVCLLALAFVPGGRGRSRRAEAAGRTAERCLRLLGLEVEMQGALPKPPFVLVANHRTYVDIGLLLAHAPVVFLSKAAIARWPIAGWVVRLVGTVFVDRRSPHSGVVAYRRLEAILVAGGAVALFPEGTTVAPGVEVPYRQGAFRLARNAGVPVVPVAIEYSVADAAWDDEGDLSLLPHFLRVFGRARTGVRLAVGAPLPADDPDAAREAAARFIRQHLLPPTGDQTAWGK